ncbi:MAG: DUF1963 domain-containing protein [Methyloligellaceae bacterium]
MGKLDKQELLKRILATQKTAVFFSRVFPPDPNSNIQSYVGGHPKLPPNLSWPLSEKDGSGLLFLGQFGIEEFPNFSTRHLLPSKGTLYFFLDKMLFLPRVLYSPRRSSELPVANAPKKLQRFYENKNYEWKHQWLTEEEYAEDPRFDIFPKWRVSSNLTITRLSEPYELGYDEDKIDYEEWEDLIFEIEHPHYDENAPIIWPPAHYSYMFEYKDEKFNLPDSDYPYCLLFIRTFAGTVKLEMHNAIAEIDKLLEKNEVLASDAQPVKERYTAALNQALKWEEKCKHKDLYQPLNFKERSLFRSWCNDLAQKEFNFEAHIKEELKEYFKEFSEYCKKRSENSQDNLTWNRTTPRGHMDRLNHSRVSSWLESSFIASIDLSFENDWESGFSFPERAMDFISYIRHRQTIVGQMMGHHYCEGFPPESYMVLMSFSTDKVMRWHWGDVGELRFWIKEEDLKQLQFHDMKLTVEGW